MPSKQGLKQEFIINKGWVMLHSHAWLPQWLSCPNLSSWLCLVNCRGKISIITRTHVQNNNRTGIFLRTFPILQILNSTQSQVLYRGLSSAGSQSVHKPEKQQRRNRRRRQKRKVKHKTDLLIDIRLVPKQRKGQHLSWRRSRRQQGALLPDTPWFHRRALLSTEA